MKVLKFLKSRLFLICLLFLIEVGLIVTGFIFLSFYFAILFLLVQLINFFLMLYVLAGNSNSAYKMSWLFVLGITSIFGTILYLIFGRKNFFSKNMKKNCEPLRDYMKKYEDNNHIIEKVASINYPVARMMTYVKNNSFVPPYENTEISFYKVGDEAFPPMLDELKKAKHFIFIEYFIIASKDEMWKSMFDILVKKAIEGVDVRIIYDDFGSISTLPRKFYKKLAKYNIKAYPYNKVKFIFDVKMNNRDHRKILVIDGHTAFTGGINIADEYINKKERFGHWKDNSIRLVGEGVNSLTQLFLSNWCFLNKKEEDFSLFSFEKYKDELDHVPTSKGYCQTYGDIPFDFDPVSQNIYVDILMKAHDYVYITTPYLILSPELTNAMTNASKHGVKVVILTPHIPDKRLVFSCSRSYYRELLPSGVQIFEYTPGFIHSKMVICDDCFATIGTSNFDFRSLFLHMECVTMLYDVPCIEEMKKDFVESIKISEKVDYGRFVRPNFFVRLGWALLRIVSPLL